MKNVTFLTFLILGVIACSTVNDKESTKTKQSTSKEPTKVIGVETVHFAAANANTSITTIDCTLSDGTKTKCFQITTNSTPTDHQMGPWCPDHISDDASAGGIWLSDGKVYDVDGAFVKNMASFHKDTTWKMYDDNGNIYVTETEQDCINAANPNVGEEYKNFCVECLPSYITEVSETFLIPVRPVLQDSPEFYKGPGGGGPRGGRQDRPKRPKGEAGKPPKGKDGGRPPRDAGSIPSTRGIALNGVAFSAPAPVDNILGAYTLAPFDDAGGHINVHQGYHYHAATGLSFSIEQSDAHAPLIGYAMDGHGIYGQLDKDGKEPTDLDDCRGHTDELRGYHYHADAAGKNNFINCLHGAYVVSE